ncbi:MAG TPA: alpha/beta hydrolase [Flavisolibacter sp.]|nr:alpha/beta hydrolase [Flavisolibacter sp.]
MKAALQNLFCHTIIGTSLLSCNQSGSQIQKQETQTAATTAIVASIVSEEIPIWTTAIPDSSLITGPETYNDGMVKNVSNPTIKVFSPSKDKNTGAAVLVFPGGGYTKLAIELEGSEICQWLASIGVTGILLKYRVPASGPYHNRDCDCETDPAKPLALQDAQRAMGLVRFRAGEWGIDPNKIGVMGFSAGGHLVADVSTNYIKRAYPLMDEADRVGCKPDFGIAIYPGHMTFHTTKPYELNSTLPVDSQTPPMFILQAGNDNIDTIQHSLVYYIALKKAGVHAEYHVYAEGGHAFGLNKSAQKIKGWEKLPIADWEALVARWLQTIKMTAD